MKTLFSIGSVYALGYLLANLFYFYSGSPREIVFLPFVEGVAIWISCSIFLASIVIYKLARRQRLPIVYWILLIPMWAINFIALADPNLMLMGPGFFMSIFGSPLAIAITYFTTPIEIVLTNVLTLMILIFCVMRLVNYNKLTQV